MQVEVAQESARMLQEYARISIAFEVRRVLDVAASVDGFELSERPIAVPYTKDYDAGGAGPGMLISPAGHSSWQFRAGNVSEAPCWLSTRRV